MPTDEEKQAFETVWAVKSNSQRKHLEEKAKSIKESANPLFQDWFQVERVFGYYEEKERYFSNNITGHETERKSWLEAIGLATSPYTDDPPSEAEMIQDWISRRIEEKKIVLKRAREEKERFVRDMNGGKEAKQFGNYKLPDGKVDKKTSRVSKPYRSRSSGYGRPGQDIVVTTADGEMSGDPSRYRCFNLPVCQGDSKGLSIASSKSPSIDHGSRQGWKIESIAWHR